MNVDEVRSWAERNEPLLRLAELLLVGLFGTVLTVGVMRQQNQLIESQLALARAQIKPLVTMTGWEGGGPGYDVYCMQVYYSRDDISDLSAYPTVFVEEVSSGKTRRVALRNFFLIDSERYKSGRVIDFKTRGDLGHAARFKFLSIPDDGEFIKSLEKAMAAKNRRVGCEVSLHYKNAVGERIHDRVLATDFPLYIHRNLDERLEYDEEIEIKDYVQPSGKFDFASLNARIAKCFPGP